VYQGAFKYQIDHLVSHNKNSSTHMQLKPIKTEQTTDRAKIAKEEHRVLGFTRIRAKMAAEGNKAQDSKREMWVRD
jgi:hypothetical protein